MVGIEAVFSSDELRVVSEDIIYDLILQWSRIHYPEIHERKDVMTDRLCPMIRFPFMSFRKLAEVLECPDMDPVFASRMVVEALHCKAKASSRQVLATKDTNHHLIQRRYKYQVVKIIDYAFPMQKCEVFMDLKRKDCEELFTTGRVDSEIIHLGGQGFFLSMHCSLDPQRSYPCFGLFLGKVDKGSSTSSIKYEFSAMMSSSEEYACDHKGYCILPRGKAVGYRNFFGLHWKDFISDDLLFISDVLHIKCVLTMQQ